MSEVQAKVIKCSQTREVLFLQLNRQREKEDSLLKKKNLQLESGLCVIAFTIPLLVQATVTKDHLDCVFTPLKDLALSTAALGSKICLATAALVGTDFVFALANLTSGLLGLIANCLRRIANVLG